MFLIDRLTSKLKLPTSETALPGRDTPIATSETHFVSGRALKPPYPDQMNEVIVGMGCFWGAERLFWEQQGVWITAVGYTAGMTLNPTYNEVCTGLTGHNEVVKIVFDPAEMSFDKVLTLFWEQHDPTQGMRQGNDTGTQYRSGIYTNSEDQRSRTTASKSAYNAELAKHGRPAITTEILPAPEFYYAEDYHQQYLAKNPNGYCNLGGVGIACPIAPSN